MEGTLPFFESCDVLIIGAGFYGAEIALEFRRLGFGRVVLVDREYGIMRRASYVNQARVHNGYHYPRSLATAERSRANFEAFIAEYADAVMLGMESVYAIATGSRVSPAQFESFCRTIGVPCQMAPRRIVSLFDQGLVQEAFVTRELAFDAARLAPLHLRCRRLCHRLPLLRLLLLLLPLRPLLRSHRRSPFRHRRNRNLSHQLLLRRAL